MHLIRDLHLEYIKILTIQYEKDKPIKNGQRI